MSWLAHLLPLLFDVPLAVAGWLGCRWLAQAGQEEDEREPDGRAR